MPEKFPALEPVRTRGVAATHQGARRTSDEQVARFASDATTAFATVVRGLAHARSAKPAAELIVDHALRMYRERAASLLDDLAELWWTSEHQGTRVRPFSSLPIGERAELRGRVKRLLSSRVPDALGDQAVLEGEPKLLLEMPQLALRRANADLERRADRDRAQWSGIGGSAMHAIFAAGQVAIAHLGDCRAVRLRRGMLDVLTREHTIERVYEEKGTPVPENLQVGLIARSVGQWGEGPDVVLSTAQTRDVFLLMSRGTHEHFTAGALREALQKHGIEAAPRLIDEAWPTAAENIAAVAVEIL